ncbi:hypothetical protein AX17_004251 [Amanita inopinata Kibby_2008]|nr:hypothetical protein AX17_004251 [Amanita inopinata Kibby_2008]
MLDITLDKASLVSLWVESLLYGAYAVLFALCVHALVHNKRTPGGLNKPLLVTAVVMFTFCTVHICVGLARAISAFVGSKDKPGGALGYYAAIWLPLNIFKQALYATNNIVADGLVVYRCYVVWGFRWKVIVIPSIMLAATTLCAYLAVYNFSLIGPGQDVFATNIAQWGTALFSLSLATNVTVTMLIASRIWWIARQANTLLGKSHGRKYNNAVAIIVESGAIYSISLLILLVLYTIKSTSQYIVYDALAQIMGIVPTLIIVRVGLGVSTQDVQTYNLTNQSHTPSATLHSAGYRHTPVPMQVRKVVHIDKDADYLDAEVSNTSKMPDDIYFRQPSMERV